MAAIDCPTLRGVPRPRARTRTRPSFQLTLAIVSPIVIAMPGVALGNREFHTESSSGC